MMQIDYFLSTYHNPDFPNTKDLIIINKYKVLMYSCDNETNMVSDLPAKPNVCEVKKKNID